MAFNPRNITKEHVIKAVEKIKSENKDLINSTRWLVKIGDQFFPPKEIMRYARQEYDGSDLWEYGGGPPTNKYLERMGFEISDMNLDNNPFLDLIRRYKSYINKEGLDDEIYKWQLVEKYKGRPDPNVQNFEEEIISLKFGNLVYHNAITAMRHIAKQRTEPYRNLFKVLYSEDLSLEKRVKDFDEESKKLFNSIFPEENLGHHHDERTISAFLTFKFPLKYTFYKDSYYKKLCQLLNITSKPKGEKYVHYIELIQDFVENYISQDEELLAKVSNLLHEDAYLDESHFLLAQDILYCVLEKNIGMKRKYWKIGTSADDTSYWDIMKNNGTIAIGWSNLGNLEELDIQDKKEIINAFRQNDVEFPNAQTESRKAGEIFDFYRNVNIGDVVLAQNGFKILAIGIITDDYNFNNSEDFSHEKSVDWKIFEPPFENRNGPQTTCYRLTDLNLISKIDRLLDDEEKTENDASKPSAMKERVLNQILYGPPGTGKTYYSKELAVRIANPDFTTQELSEADNRIEINQEYQRLFELGQIVFTTFHQSFSYEDFVEGIKPLPPEFEGDSISYAVQAGIFKNLCTSAKTPNQQSFDSAYESLIKDLGANEEIQEIKTPTGKNFGISLNSQNNLNLHTGGERKKQGTLTKGNILKEISGEERYPYWEGYFQGVIDHLKRDYHFKNGESAISKNHVLIIDEINRGNISSIFGELITLLEEDKRIGNEEQIKVELPYSKVSFGVPNNLYIIGTMNTADRSVEALDTALRRRFTFKEVMPKPKLLRNIKFEGFNLEEVLITLNYRIEALLDRDHTIGHSYFMSIKSGNKDALKQVFDNKIIPLLQEYFYHDYEKIALILGEGFVEMKEEKVKFAIFKNLEPPEFIASYELKKGIDDIEAAVRNLLNRKDEAKE